MKLIGGFALAFACLSFAAVCNGKETSKREYKTYLETRYEAKKKQDAEMRSDSPTAAPTVAMTTVAVTDEVTEFPIPAGFIDYDFDNDTAGWTLGRNNGAAWRRWPTFLQEVKPPEASFVLHVIDTDVYSGTVLAMSPRLRVGDTGRSTLFMLYYMNASFEFPTYLKLRRRLSYDTYDAEPLINMDASGNQMNQQYMMSALSVDGLTPGQEFNLVLEANLGIDNSRTEITVSRIIIDGVVEVPYEESSFFDFSDGLVGWQAGSMDGGKWVLTPYNEISQDVIIPPPLSGSILLVERFDIHSGVITIESPPLEIVPLTQKNINLRFLIKGSVDYPVLLRLTLKSIDGDYDEQPFLDLKEYGDFNMVTWQTLETHHPIPEVPRADYFQIAVEVDLGSDIDNFVAIDYIEIETIDLAEEN